VAGLALLKSSAAILALAAAGSLAAQSPAPVAPAPVPAAPAVAPAKGPAAKPAPQKALDKPLWNTLSRPQQVALEPLAGEWDRMEGVRKQKWLEIANRFSSMKPDEQARVHDRMRDWLKMTPEERRVVRENYTRTKKIDPSQKTQQWEQYQQLPEEQKKQLAADAASARAKKQVANLPTRAQSNVKTVPPIQHPASPAPACPAGTIKNPAAAAPPCVTAAAPAAPAPAATPAPVTNAK
jgi:hypothetical protein